MGLQEPQETEAWKSGYATVVRQGRQEDQGLMDVEVMEMMGVEGERNILLQWKAKIVAVEVQLAAKDHLFLRPFSAMTFSFRKLSRGT